MTKQKMKPKVLVGLSGGVDSAVAAYLLQKDGYDVHAVFMKNFSLPIGNAACPWKDDLKEARKVAKHLRILLKVWNFEREYHERVLDYMVTEYQRGRTPNPDVMCNTMIKFGVFLERAREEGFNLIATGHYAGVKKTKDGIYHLLKGIDGDKDQSYFLSGLTQAQLRHVLFPLAEQTKPRVRALAKRCALPNADRKDSQGICFVGTVAMGDFLKQWIAPKQGDVVDVLGNKLGTHHGVYYYTIGQRRGISVGGGPALYVIDKDVKRNRLVVGAKDDLQLFKQDIVVRDWRWLARSYSLPIRCKAKIRYRQTDQTVTIKKLSATRISVRFAKPQRAIASGQIFVAYKGREVIGSGVIS